MDMKKLEELIDDLKLECNIQLNDIPEIDLYMDQVIQLFENKLGALRRGEEDKILTKTMINNYAKGKLLMSINNKKYSKEHIILMSLIYNLKGALSITDIKTLLSGVVDSHDKKDKREIDLNKIYNMYISSTIHNANIFKNQIKNEVREMEEKLNNIEEGFGQYEKNLLLVCSLINSSNMYRRLAEKILDQNIKNNI
jgi:hypothetical protein